jgi:hypothetical protein
MAKDGMSRGPGQIEQRISELFATTKDRALSIADICDHAFRLAGEPASQTQRLSATRAAHRLIRRAAAVNRKSIPAFDEAFKEAARILGRSPERTSNDVIFTVGSRWIVVDHEYAEVMKATATWSAYRKAWRRLHREVQRFKPIFGWQGTETEARRIWFHPGDYPIRVWTVSIQPAGVIWADAEVVSITERDVMVRYAGELAWLDRVKLSRWWAFWRGVMFVSRRTGRIAQRLDEIWQKRYGHAAGGLPPVMQMPLAEAMVLLGVPANYTRDGVVVAFRRAVKKAHPDLVGTAEMFRKLVEARDRMLAALGTSAPKPRMPTYYPSGTRVVYRSSRRRSQHRLG